MTAGTSCRQYWQLSQAVADFDSCYKLLPALTAVTSCCWLWQLLQAITSCRQLWQFLVAVASHDCCYMLMAALTAVTSCCQLWQQLQAVYSFDSSRQLWRLLQAFPSFDTCYKLLPALTAVTSCWQPHLNFITTSTLLKYLIPSLRVNSLSPALTAVTAVASFASCYKLLAAKPLFHFNINAAWIFDSISKGQFIKSSTRSSVSESVSQWVPDKRRLWSDLGPIKMKGRERPSFSHIIQQLIIIKYELVVVQTKNNWRCLSRHL